VATGQVDDGQAAHRNATGAIDVHAFVVRPTVRSDVAHGAEHGRWNGLRVHTIDSVNAAHGRASDFHGLESAIAGQRPLVHTLVACHAGGPGTLDLDKTPCLRADLRP